jgi:hypothetical protein
MMSRRSPSSERKVHSRVFAEQRPVLSRLLNRAAWYVLHFALDFARRDPSRSHKSNENQLRNSSLRERNRRGAVDSQEIPPAFAASGSDY